MSNPWRIDESDQEEVIRTPCNRRVSLPPKPPTPQVPRRLTEQKTLDWSPEIVEEEQAEKHRFRRRKTAPSFERAPSHHRPIFSGSSSLRSSSNSLFEGNHQPKTIHNYIPDTPPASPSNSTSQYDPFGMIQEDLNRFIYSYIPKEQTLFFHCYLRRDREGFQKGLFPTYYLHVERPSDGKKILLLAARKVAKLKQQSEYIISTNIETLSEKSCGAGYAGRLRANGITGTEYTLYDNGKSPNKYGYKSFHAKHGLRRELAGIIYNTNVLGFKGPREMNAIIPKLDQDIQPAQGEETILDRWETQQLTDTIQLRNQSPNYKEGSKAPMLQFTSNLPVQSSVKNFQLVMGTETHNEEIVLQFARLNKDTFLCDFRYPLSPIQAFGIALSSFDSTIARE